MNDRLASREAGSKSAAIVAPRYAQPRLGKEAFQRFPELIDRFDLVESPYHLWIELTHEFMEAYKAPRNEDLISRIYAYADWCCSQPRRATAEDDLLTCVTVCFLEHIPQSPQAVEDMPRWFSRDEALTMKEIFSYLVGKEGFQRILLVYERFHPTARKVKS